MTRLMAASVVIYAALVSVLDRSSDDLRLWAGLVALGTLASDIADFAWDS